MLRLIQGYNLSFPIYLDMEDKVQAVLSDSERGNIASVFCNIIQAVHIREIIRCGSIQVQDM